MVLIWRAAGRGEVTGNPSDIFNNVPTNYQPAFDYLVSLGVLTEADAVDGEFGLNRLASFEEDVYKRQMYATCSVSRCVGRRGDRDHPGGAGPDDL